MSDLPLLFEHPVIQHGNVLLLQRGVLEHLICF